MNKTSSSSDEETFCHCLGLHLIVGGFKSGSSSDAKTKCNNIYFMDINGCELFKHVPNLFKYVWKILKLFRII